MSDLLLVFLTAAIVNNFVLVQFLGLCPFMGVSNRLDTAIPMGVATAFVLTVATAATYLIDRYVLVPFDLTYLKVIAFIVVIASLVQVTELYVKAVSPLLHRLLGIYLPLITTNCAVLGVALIATTTELTFFEAMTLSLGAAAGFSFAITCFAALRERMNEAAVPAPFRGAPIALVSVGIMSLALYGFRGMGQ